MTLAKRTNNYFPAFPSLFNDFFNRDLLDWNNLNFSNTATTVPAVNVKEDEDKFEIEVAVPGMRKEDFKVNLENDMMTISSERKEEKNDEKKGQYSRKEFSYQSFQRSFSLPEGQIKTDKIVASYKDGVLQITLPKREEVKPKPPKQIAIS